ncbi:MAG: DNA-processing protein DprA [Prevotellaceae bacterium]|nr:DNA-processing protein DprA [Candidatus Colivivens equi]
MKANSVLIHLSLEHHGDWQKIFNSIQSTDHIGDENKAEGRIKAELHFGAAKALTLLDADYPESLKKIQQPPFVLYYRGDISLLNSDKKKLSICGSKVPVACNTDTLKNYIPEDVIVVSGGGVGIDTSILGTCFERGQPAIIVLGSGINCSYPATNQGLFEAIVDNGGLILSEYPPMEEVSPEKLVMRTRIVSGLGDGLFVPECRVRSSSFYTIMGALQSGKPVMLLPTDPKYADQLQNNMLISEGAELVLSAQHITEILNKQ